MRLALGFLLTIPLFAGPINYTPLGAVITPDPNTPGIFVSGITGVTLPPTSIPSGWIIGGQADWILAPDRATLHVHNFDILCAGSTGCQGISVPIGGSVQADSSDLGDVGVLLKYALLNNPDTGNIISSGILVPGVHMSVTPTAPSDPVFQADPNAVADLGPILGTVPWNINGVFPMDLGPPTTSRIITFTFAFNIQSNAPLPPGTHIQIPDSLNFEFQTVPEPEAWGLMAGALTVLGGIRRFKRKS